MSVTVLGGGLAGCEAAWQLAQRGIPVNLYEMKPGKKSPAHHLDTMAELVCSNSLRSDRLTNAVGLLKAEMRLLGSLIMRVADETAVPAGGALAVDRDHFSEGIDQAIHQHPLITVIPEEVTEIPAEGTVIIATGPLTSDGLSEAIAKMQGLSTLHFYDAAAPIVTADSLDTDKIFRMSRYDRGEDYLNCPMTREEYFAFVHALQTAETAEMHGFEEKAVFEGCMPVEVMAKRGYDTMRFGMLKPVGLTDPKTGRRPYAVLQLRKETQDGSAYNLVGFQTNLKFSEQKRIFSMIPALNHAEFLRYGVMHRNSYLYSPDCLTKTFRLRGGDAVYFGGQITGVEGYVESIMSGLLAAIHLSREIGGLPESVPPKTTMCGALSRYITLHNKNFQPMNSNFGILPAVEGRDKNERRTNYVARAVSDMENYVNALNRDEELSG